jgi:ABC-type uncharacterized transport system ATPase subunit
MVHQNFMLVPSFTVAENIVLRTGTYLIEDFLNKQQAIEETVARSPNNTACVSNQRQLLIQSMLACVNVLRSSRPFIAALTS